MKSREHLILLTSPPLQPARNPRKTASPALRQRRLHGSPRRNNTGKELDTETGLCYFGARYLDPKASRWISGDPALGEYVPVAPVNDEAKKRNGNLPGMGGVFNYVNLHVYHYARNNPVKYIDPDGETVTLRQVLELLKEFGEIFSFDFKVGIGFNISFISSVRVDLFSRQATFSLKNGYTERFTTGIGAWIVGISRTVPCIESLGGIEALQFFGETEINVGPVIFNEKTGIDVVFSFGGQALVGLNINISGKETLEFLAKIGELQNALRE